MENLSLAFPFLYGLASSIIALMLFPCVVHAPHRSLRNGTLLGLVLSLICGTSGWLGWRRWNGLPTWEDILIAVLLSTTLALAILLRLNRHRARTRRRVVQRTGTLSMHPYKPSPPVP